MRRVGLLRHLSNANTIRGVSILVSPFRGKHLGLSHLRPHPRESLAFVAFFKAATAVAIVAFLQVRRTTSSGLFVVQYVSIDVLRTYLSERYVVGFFWFVV